MIIIYYLIIIIYYDIYVLGITYSNIEILPKHIFTKFSAFGTEFLFSIIRRQMPTPIRIII